MIDFIPIQEKSREEIAGYLKYSDSRSCDMPFATLYLWRDFYQLEYALVDDFLITHSCSGDRESFSFPIGKNEPVRAVELLIGHCEEKGIPCLLNSITKKEEKWLKLHFPGQFEVNYNRDYADYIYETEALIALRGKKYHGKKNHINKFMKLYDWSYEQITDNSLPECLALLDAWEEENHSDDPELAAEIAVSIAAIRQREFLGLKSGLIRADGRVVAFTLGEEICRDTFCIHVEKACSDVPGAYAMINQQFLIHEAADYKYVNREDDVGEPGLRKAKLSYHPAFLLEKGQARYIYQDKEGKSL